MSSRFGLGPLLGGLKSGLRKRRRTDAEPADVWTRAVLVGVPTAGAAVAIWQEWIVTVPQDLLAGIALLIGAELAAFSQLAAWRERLNQRNLGKEIVRRRALDEAVAHVLVSTLAATVAAGLLVAISVIDPGKNPREIVEVSVRAMSGLILGLLAYLALTLWIVVNLLWDAYQDANGNLNS